MAIVELTDKMLKMEVDEPMLSIEKTDATLMMLPNEKTHPNAKKDAIDSALSRLKIDHVL